MAQEQDNAPEQPQGVDTNDLVVEDQFGNRIPNGQEDQDSSQEERPEGLPEGFNSWDELAAKYAELTAGQEGQEEADSQEEPAKEDTGLTEDQKRIQSLETQLHDREIYDLVGGKDSYEQMSQWAEQHLPESEVDMLNDVWDSPNLEAKKFAARALQAMYQEQNGSEGQRIGGNTAPGVTPINDDGQLQEAMRDPRYRRRDSVGESYRSEVDKRLMAGMGKTPAQPNVDGWVSI